MLFMKTHSFSAQTMKVMKVIQVMKVMKVMKENQTEMNWI